MSDVNTTEAPIAKPEPVATLYIPNRKDGLAVRVYGVSNNGYDFKPDRPGDELVCRRYYDVAQFEKEELDIRKNVGQPIVVCTLVGPGNPVARLNEALEGLIGATLRVAKDNRRDALTAAAKRIDEALVILNTPDEEEPETPALPPVAPVEVPGPLEQAEAQAADVPPPVVTVEVDPVPPPPAVPAPTPEPTPAPAVSTEPGKVYTQAELMQMEYNALKALGKEYGVPPQSRAVLVAGIIEKQGK